MLARQGPIPASHVSEGKEEHMVVNLDAYCAIRYGLEGPPTKAQRNTVSKMCRDGKLDAYKSGKRWFIRLEDANAEEMEDAPQV